MLLATIPAMLGSNWILSRKAANYLTAAANEKLAATTDKLAKGVDAWVDDVGRELQVFSRDPDIVSMNPRRQRLRLLQLHDAFPQITFSFTTGPDGLNVARADDKPPINYGDLDWFHRVMAGAPIARETLVKARTTGRPGLYQAAPILASAARSWELSRWEWIWGLSAMSSARPGMAARVIPAWSTNRDAHWRTPI